MSQFLEISDIEAAMERNVYLNLKNNRRVVAPLRTGSFLDSKEQYLNRFKKPNNILLAGSPFQLKPRPPPPPAAQSCDNQSKCAAGGDADEISSPLSEFVRGAGHYHRTGEDPYASFFDDIKGWEEESTVNSLFQLTAAYQYNPTNPLQFSNNDQPEISSSSSATAATTPTTTTTAYGSGQNMNAIKKKKKTSPSHSLVLTTEEDSTSDETVDQKIPKTRPSTCSVRPKTAPARQPFVYYSESPKTSQLSSALSVVAGSSPHVTPFADSDLPSSEGEKEKPRFKSPLCLRIKQCKSASLKNHNALQMPLDIKDGIGVIQGKKYSSADSVPRRSPQPPRASPLKSRSMLPVIFPSVYPPLIPSSKTKKKDSSTWIINGKSSHLHKSANGVVFDDHLSTTFKGVKLSSFGFQKYKHPNTQ